VYGRWVVPLERRRQIIGALLFSMATVVVFRLLLVEPTAWTAGAFYVWFNVFTLLLVSQFFLITGDLFDPRQAKRIFGFIAGGGLVGGAVGLGVGLGAGVGVSVGTMTTGGGGGSAVGDGDGVAVGGSVGVAVSVAVGVTVGSGDQARGFGAFDGVVARLDGFTLPLLLALAALLRFPNLITRGSWEADQGRDMLILRAMVRDGVVPLVGPPTSIGDLHHGPWFYYLLSPAAALTGGDSPLAVTAFIALAGIATVAVVWWLARQMGGPVAGAVAGSLAAVSVAGVESSTFIWSPNFIGLTSALSLAATWRAWTGGDRR